MATDRRPVALVTGAAGGIGGAIAWALGAAGFDIVLTGRDLALLDDLKDRLYAAGVASTAIGYDLTDDDARESFDRCVAVNLRAQFFLTQAVARRMIGLPSSRRRTIVTVTTVAVDHHVGRVLAEYCISKAGLAHSVQHWAARLDREGIDCYEVRPGMMKTDMTATTRERYDALIASGFVPAARWGDIGEVGRAVALLARGELSYATGQTLHIDGGMRFKVF